jgi:hypothetical protein
LQIINELGVKVKGEGKNCELAECAMRGRVSAEAHLHTRENGEGNTTEGEEWEESRSVARKRWEERRKRGRVSQESPLVFILTSSHPEKRKLFLAKTTDIQNKKFTFALDKTQLSLFLPHCGVHIAQNYGETRTSQRKCSLTY